LIFLIFCFKWVKRVALDLPLRKRMSCKLFLSSFKWVHFIAIVTLLTEENCFVVSFFSFYSSLHMGSFDCFGCFQNY